MSDTEDPYAVSSDSEDEEQLRKPPPKINIEGRAVADIKQLTAAITEKKDSAKDEARLEEIEELRKAKAAEMTKMKEEFEKGTVHNAEAVSETAKTEEKEKPSGLDKSTLSAFKNKFEKFHQNEESEVETLDDRLKSFALDGVGKENLANMRTTFEKLQRGEISINDVREGTGVDFECSEADKRRILAAFIGPKSDDDIPKTCALCEKTVYPVERLFANKKLYHSNCFRCKTCNKKLSATQYNIHEGVLYCKPHYQEVLHPELTHANVEDTPGSGEDEEEDEFAIVSKPKQLSSDVVRSGTNIGDELQQLRSLKEKKENLQESFKAQENIDKPKDFLDIHGNVKDRMSKILAGGDKDDEDEKDSDEEKQKDLEAIKAQVSDVKNKWKTGEVEKAETKDADAKNELEELRKGGIKVRERFNERLQPATDDSVNKSYNAHELDTSSAAEARKSFLDGAAFQTGPVEKTANDLQDIKFTGLNSFKDKFEKGEGDGDDHRERQILDLDVQLNSIKGALEKGGVDESDMTPEERAERKKKEIEAEFLRYKLARKIQAKKAAENAEAEPEEPAADEKPHLDVEVKMAGKAREKFKNIEAQNPNSVPLPKQETKHKPSKWDTKKEPVAEVVNKRVVEESSEEEEDESAFDVKNLMNKFKNIKTDDTKVEKANLEELEELRKQAKNLRKQFEQKNELEDAEQAEEKRKELAEEFKRLKEEREKMQQQLKEEEDQKEKTPEEKEEVNVAADHASKMTAKWEKIHAKEAKKAGKSKMPTKST